MKNNKVEKVEKGGEGNTKLRPKQYRRYSFTLNNYTDLDIENIMNVVNKKGYSYIIGKEIGELEQVPHLQGYIESVKKFRFTELKLTNRIHYEAARGDRASNIKYCSKDGNYVYSDNCKPLECISTLRPWQQKIVDIYNTPPNGRTLNWVYDEKGNNGKSALCKYLNIKFNVLTIQGGKLGDIMNMVYNLKDIPKMICIDIPRNGKNKVSYSAIECLLNGMITNVKYETGTRLFNPPHVVVFSN